MAVMNSSGCKELQLPAVKMLTEKNALQNLFLKTLQSIVKIREVLKKYTKPDENAEDATAEKEEKKMEVGLTVKCLLSFCYINSLHIDTLNGFL